MKEHVFTYVCLSWIMSLEGVTFANHGKDFKEKHLVHL